MRDTTVIHWVDTTVGYWWFILGLGALCAFATGWALWRQGGRARELSLAAAALAFEAPAVHAGYDAFGLWGAFGGWLIGLLVGAYLVMLAGIVVAVWCLRAATWGMTLVVGQVVVVDVVFGLWLHAVEGIGIVAVIWGIDVACDRFEARFERWFDRHMTAGFAVLWTLYPLLLPGYIRLADPPWSGVDTQVAHALTDALVLTVPPVAVLVAVAAAVLANAAKLRAPERDAVVASIAPVAVWFGLGSVAISFGAGLQDFVGWGALCATIFLLTAWARGARTATTG